MKWIVFAASIVAAVSAYSSAPAVANDLSDVVRARGNARAGGATSGHDAWVIKQYGGRSGGQKAKAAAKKKAAAKRKAAKRRAYLKAKKKKEAERRAYLAAKKKKEAEQRALAAKKAKQEKLAAAKAEQEKQAKADDTKVTDDSKETTTTTAAPSTAALLTGQDAAQSKSDKTDTGDTTEVATAKGDAATKTDTVETTETAPTVGKTDTTEEGCKRYVPAVGLTVSVGCEE